jgi:ATP-binding cassette, subfamily B, multidrug efflux pump
MSAVSGKAFDFRLLKRVMRYVKPYRVQFNFAVVLTIVLAIIAILRTELIGYTINYISGSLEERPVPGMIELFNSLVAGKSLVIGLQIVVIAVISLILVEALLYYYQVLIANRVAQSVTIDLRTRLFRHITTFRLKYFDQTAIGTLVTRVISDIETIAEIFYEGLISIAGDIVKLITVVIVMFWVNWELALWTLVPIPVLIIATRLFQLSIKRSFQ